MKTKICRNHSPRIDMENKNIYCLKCNKKLGNVKIKNKK